MPLTVLAVADQVSDLLYEYFRPERWRNVDLVLSCGDLPPAYLDFLCSSLDVPVFYVRGNHDADYETSRYDGCDDIHGRIVEYRGIRIAGFQGSYRYNGNPYQYSEREMQWIVRWSRIRAWRMPPDIILTHAPPAVCHAGSDLCHRGFKAFDNAIEVWRPRYFIHGHMHAYQCEEPETRVGDTIVLNPFPYQVFQIEPARERLASREPSVDIPRIEIPSQAASRVVHPPERGGA